MGQGQGSITISQRKEQSGGVPFPAGSADNGLSVDPVTGTIVLGAALANILNGQLLSNRYIDLNNFSLNATNAAAQRYFRLDPALSLYQIGDIDSSANGTFLSIEDIQGEFFAFIRTGFRGMELSAANNHYYFGDIDSFQANGLSFLIDSVPNARIKNQFGDFLSLNVNSGIYAMGDISGTSNSTMIRLQDGSQVVTIQAGIETMLSLDAFNQNYRIGDVNGAGNNTKIVIDDAGGEISLFATNGVTLPSLFTAGSVLFVGPTKKIAQDNANFFWDDANNRLGIGTNAPAVNLHILTAGNDSIIRLRSFSNTYWTDLDNNAAGNGDFIINNTGNSVNNQNIKFWFNGTEVARINGSGKLGIGVSPTQAIDILGNIKMGGAGNKLFINAGANGSIGISAAMVAGTTVVATTAVTAASLIFLSYNTIAGVPGILSPGVIVAGVSFVINSLSPVDTSTVNWWIVN